MEEASDGKTADLRGANDHRRARPAPPREEARVGPAEGHRRLAPGALRRARGGASKARRPIIDHNGGGRRRPARGRGRRAERREPQVQGRTRGPEPGHQDPRRRRADGGPVPKVRDGLSPGQLGRQGDPGVGFPRLQTTPLRPLRRGRTAVDGPEEVLDLGAAAVDASPADDPGGEEGAGTAGLTPPSPGEGPPGSARGGNERRAPPPAGQDSPGALSRRLPPPAADATPPPPPPGA